jgi:ribonuclease VapC
MFLDASAMVAIITREPDHAELTARLEAATRRETSPLALFETALGVS